MRFLSIPLCLMMVSCSLKKGEQKNFTIFVAPKEYAEKKPTEPSGNGLPAIDSPANTSLQPITDDLRIPDVLREMPTEREFKGSRSNPNSGTGVIAVPPKD